MALQGIDGILQFRDGRIHVADLRLLAVNGCLLRANQCLERVVLGAERRGDERLMIRWEIWVIGRQSSARRRLPTGAFWLGKANTMLIPFQKTPSAACAKSPARRISRMRADWADEMLKLVKERKRSPPNPPRESWRKSAGRLKRSIFAFKNCSTHFSTA